MGEPAGQNAERLTVLHGGVGAWRHGLAGTGIGWAGSRPGTRGNLPCTGESGDAVQGAVLIRTDRRQPGAYDQVVEHNWDAVMEVSWQPRLVRDALSALGDGTQHSAVVFLRGASNSSVSDQ